MDKIKITRTTTASGKRVDEGEVYKIPEEISLRDAEILIGLKKAHPFSGESKPAKPKRDDAAPNGGPKKDPTPKKK